VIRAAPECPGETTPDQADLRWRSTVNVGCCAPDHQTMGGNTSFQRGTPVSGPAPVRAREGRLPMREVRCDCAVVDLQAKRVRIGNRSIKFVQRKAPDRGRCPSERPTFHGRAARPRPTPVARIATASRPWPGEVGDQPRSTYGIGGSLASPLTVGPRPWVGDEHVGRQLRRRTSRPRPGRRLVLMMRHRRSRRGRSRGVLWGLDVRPADGPAGGQFEATGARVLADDGPRRRSARGYGANAGGGCRQMAEGVRYGDS